jgi:hypothetical protein
MTVKTVDRTFLKGQSVDDLFHAAIKSQATRDPYERRLIGILKRMDAKSADAFIEFARNHPALAENKIMHSYPLNEQEQTVVKLLYFS